MFPEKRDCHNLQEHNKISISAKTEVTIEHSMTIIGKWKSVKEEVQEQIFTAFKFS